MKRILNPGRWVLFPDGDLGIIAQYAPYVREDQEHYFIYIFTPKGTYRHGGLYERKPGAFRVTKAPSFARYIVVFPAFLRRKAKQPEDWDRPGLIDTRRNLVAVDEWVIHSKTICQYIVGYFRDWDTWTAPNPADCDGAVIPRSIGPPRNAGIFRGAENCE